LLNQDHVSHPRRNSEVRARRQQLRHPAYAKPKLLAEAPNQVWSWDINKLMGPAKWSYFYLYVALDIVSRRVVQPPLSGPGRMLVQHRSWRRW